MFISVDVDVDVDEEKEIDQSFQLTIFMSEQSEDSSLSSSRVDEDLSTVDVNPPDIVKPQRKSFSSNHEGQNGDQQHQDEVIDEHLTVVSDPDSSVGQEETGPIDLNKSPPVLIVQEEEEEVAGESLVEERTETDPVDLDESPVVSIDPALLLLEDEKVPPIAMSEEFHLNSRTEEKEEQLKTQRDLDEEEVIPPALDSPQGEGKSSPSVSIDHEEEEEEEEEVIDSRPLTALEDPFGIENPLNERRNSRPLANVVEEKAEVLIPVIELCQPSFEDVSSIDHSNSQLDPTAILPPLDSLSLAMETTNLDPPELPKEEEENLCSPLTSEVEDVLGNKTLLKQTLSCGRENSRPTRSTLVTVCYRLLLVENVDGRSRLVDEVVEEKFFVGESDILPSIDICVQLMNEGEKALIDSDIRHCYGERGLEEKGIPSTSKDSPSYRMKIELELQRWSPPPDPQTLQVNERLFWGDKKRERGNFFYRREDYSNAVQCYRGALRFLDLELNPLLSSSSVEDRSILIDRYIQVENNVAQVNLHLSRFDACLTAVENVLRYDPINGKALFRQGKALFQLGRYDLALQSLTKLPSRLNSSSDQETLQQMIQTSRAKIENEKKNEKEIYKRMFQPTTTPKTTTTNASNRRETEMDKSSSAWGNYLALGGVALALLAATLFIVKRRQT